MDQMTIQKSIKKVDEKFDNVKKNSSELYKTLEQAKTKEDSEKLIEYNKKINELLKEIKEESKNLDYVEIPEICFKTDDAINEERIKNCNTIQAFAQHIRGCKQAFATYSNKIESKNK